MKALRNNSKRAVVRQILNRKKIYALAKYVKIVSKAIGRKISKSEIKTCLKHMHSERQIDVSFNGEYVIGFSITA